MNGVTERFSSSPFDQKLTENCSVVIFETPNGFHQLNRSRRPFLN